MIMKKANILCILVSLASVLCFLSLSGQTQAQDVTCTGSGTPLQAAIDAANPGDTITVTGPCSENVVIAAYQNNITLDGGGLATIDGIVSTSPTILSLGREITITGFTITGGSPGILVDRGGTARIDGNTIENTAGFGIALGLNSGATIINNTIQSNLNGIGLAENSSARIGLFSHGDTVAKPNTIQNNGVFGIFVAGSSYALIVGNMISNNTVGGVGVVSASQADISDNIINGNLYGILVSQNSGVNLGNDTGALPVNLPNFTTVNNGLWGVRATLGSYVDGRRGSLKGVKGRISVGSGSINSTIP
jgi:parallel beta-helix repeat protein